MKYKLEKCECWNCKSYKEAHFDSLASLLRAMLNLINEKNDGYDWKVFVEGEEVK